MWHGGDSERYAGQEIGGPLCAPQMDSDRIHARFGRHRKAESTEVP